MFASLPAELSFFVRSANGDVLGLRLFVRWISTESVSDVQVVLVFPGPQAVSVQDMLRSLRDRSAHGSHDSCEPCPKRLRTEAVVEGPARSESQVSPLQKVVFIDSTWNQTNKISTDERLHGENQTLRRAC